MIQLIKDPQAILNYGFDWADGGANDGTSSDTGWLQSDTITASTWTVGGGTSLVIDSDSNDTTTTTVVLSGGTANTTYTVTNHITTAAGYEDERSIQVKAQER